MAMTTKIILLLLGFTIDVALSLPTITPADSEYSIATGDNFTLTCKSDSPITWTIPVLTIHNVTSVQEHNIKEYEEDGLYVSELQIIHANDLAVGFYYCNETNNPDSYASMYLYVEDDEVLYYGRNDLIVASGKQYSPLVIPCRPTSPSVDVKLYSGIGEEQPNEDEVPWKKTPLGLNRDGSTWEFDRRIGFLWDAPTKVESAIHACVFDNYLKKSELRILTFVKKVYSLIRQPIVRQVKDVVYNTEHENLQLICEVEVDQGQSPTFKWRFRGSILQNNKKYTIIENTTSNQRDPFSTLLVRNITKRDDQGNYTCFVSDGDNDNENNLDVAILPKGMNFLYVSESNNIFNNTCFVKCDPITWNINVTTFPPAKIIWMDNRNRTIHNNRHKIVNTNRESVLIMNNITIADRGIFTIKADNSYTTKILSVFLDVRDKPNVKILSDDFHVVGAKEKVKCEVTGFPDPDIMWEFKPCRDDTCDFEPIASTTQPNGFAFISTVTIKADQSGYVKCYAQNIYGVNEQIENYIVTDVKDGFKMTIVEDDVELATTGSKKIQLSVGDEVTFKCNATLQNYTKDLKWYINGTLMEYADGGNSTYTGFTPESSYTSYSTQKSFTIERLSSEHSGVYKCVAQKKSKSGTNVTVIEIQVIDPEVPKIISTNMKKPQIELIYPNAHNFTCNYAGVPRPSITWLKDGHEFYPDNKRIKYDKDKQMLLFTSTQLSDEGEYTCKVQNRIETTHRTSAIIFSNKTSLNYYYFILLAFFIILLIILCSGLLIKIRKEKKLERALKLAGLANFEKGAVECINPDLGIDDQAELLPYDKESWEIPREHFKLGKQLGAGAFGVVMKAILENYIDNGTPLTVAVKMVKKTAHDTYLRALVSELKIMVHLGKHLNVVNLIGACTKHIVKRELYVIVEYCRFGNLHNYLLRHRENFINQIDPVTGKIDYSIGAEVLSRSFSVSSNHSQEGPPKDMMDYRSNSNYNGTIQTTEVTLVSMSPSGSQGDEPLMSNNSAQPEWRSNYKGDYKGNVKPICTKDLLTWAFQVSRGMEYLALRKVLHGDLAARNILLADNNVVKICDFGLAKSMYKSDNYKKKGDGPLPIKWMSVESIRDKVFSTQSDVWSFGIVLWEFFSLARTPYPGMEADERLFQKLVEGYRMDSPTYATKEIYTMMLDCWEPKPLDRPSFTKLSDRIGNMLEESVKKHYIDLNDPYLVMNTQRFQGGQSDYLQMVSPPDFEKLSTPHYVNDLPPTPITATSDYMPMKPGNIFSPRERDGEVFTFSELNNKDANTPELTPMLRHDSDGGTQPGTPQTAELPSYANPTYNKLDFLKQKDVIVDLPDNYVNMPKNKSAIKHDKHDFIKDESHYVNNVSRDWEKVQ